MISETWQLPSTYAHFRFGNEVLRRLPACLADEIENQKKLFLIGIHGPDLLFYYKPLSSNQINRIGYGSHKLTGAEFFGMRAEAFANSPNQEGFKSYLIGTVCHFALDSFCHPIILEKAGTSDMSHSEIELAFDRYLLACDGFDPVHHHLVDHIVPDRVSSSVIAHFYSPASSEDIILALKSMHSCIELLTSRIPFKRQIFDAVLFATGNYEKMHGMLLPKNTGNRFGEVNAELEREFNKALEVAPEMVCEVLDFMGKKTSLGGLFQKTFSGSSEQPDSRTASEKHIGKGQERHDTMGRAVKLS